MRDYITLGATPGDEECAQVGDPDYGIKARVECTRYLEGLRRMFGPEAGDARLKIKSSPHDFGSYYEVVCYYNAQNADEVEWAFNVEGNLPATWEELER